MNPVAFEVFGIGIRWYGILISLGMIIASVMILKTCKKYDIDENKVIDMILWVIPSAIIGARAYYVIFNWHYYAGDFMKMINIRGGGLAIHGGVIGGLIAGYFYTKKVGIDFWFMADIVAPWLVFAQGIGRWGNFINQEAHGGPTDLPWGIIVNGQKVHPTFLYESIWDFGVFAVLILLSKNKKFDGKIFTGYMILYSIGRFFVEGLRTDSLMLGPLRMAQVISIVLIVLGVIINRVLARKA